MLSKHFRPALALAAVVGMSLATPAAAGIEEAVKALQANDVATAEKELQLLARERDPRAQYLMGLYVYGNPESKLFDLGKAAALSIVYNLIILAVCWVFYTVMTTADARADSEARRG